MICKVCGGTLERTTMTGTVGNTITWMGTATRTGSSDWYRCTSCGTLSALSHKDLMRIAKESIERR